MDSFTERISRCPVDYVCQDNSLTEVLNPYDPEERRNIWCRHKDYKINESRKRKAGEDFVSATTSSRWLGGRFNLNKWPAENGLDQVGEPKHEDEELEEGEFRATVDVTESLTRAFATAELLGQPCEATVRVQGAIRVNDSPRILCDSITDLSRNEPGQPAVMSSCEPQDSADLDVGAEVEFTTTVEEGDPSCLDHYSLYASIFGFPAGPSSP